MITVIITLQPFQACKYEKYKRLYDRYLLAMTYHFIRERMLKMVMERRTEVELWLVKVCGVI